jgi:pimeloyl-ACP methyl ester carboxylesterase
VALGLALCAPARGAGREQKLRLADGVELAYVVAGRAEPALVLVHCGNCRKEIWTETLGAFAGAQRVVALDLPGHGRSGGELAPAAGGLPARLPGRL